MWHDERSLAGRRGWQDRRFPGRAPRATGVEGGWALLFAGQSDQEGRHHVEHTEPTRDAPGCRRQRLEPRYSDARTRLLPPMWRANPCREFHASSRRTRPPRGVLRRVGPAHAREALDFVLGRPTRRGGSPAVAGSARAGSPGPCPTRRWGRRLRHGGGARPKRTEPPSACAHAARVPAGGRGWLRPLRAGAVGTRGTRATLPASVYLFGPPPPLRAGPWSLPCRPSPLRGEKNPRERSPESPGFFPAGIRRWPCVNHAA
jgi:hypothetical protein